MTMFKPIFAAIPNAWIQAMRRQTRLKVMYWPIFASTCIILIFIGFAPLTSALRPAFVAAWAGGDFGTKLGRWLPGSYLETRSAALPWVDLAAQNSPKSESRDIRRPTSVPRTLLVQNQVNGLQATANIVGPRAEIDDSNAPRVVHSPNEFQLDPAKEFSHLAEATLFAPIRNDDEELAGLDRAATLNVRLASRPLTSEQGTYGILKPSPRLSPVHVGDDIRDTSKRMGESTRRGHGLGGGWPEAPQLKIDLESVARIAAAKGISRFASTGSHAFSVENWQADVAESLGMLTSLPSVTSRDAGEILAKLQSLATIGQEAGEATNDREIQIRLLRAVHGLDRRLAIWNAVWRTSQGVTVHLGDIAPSAEQPSAEQPSAEQPSAEQPSAEQKESMGYSGPQADETSSMIANLRADASASDDVDGWLRFLMIDELEEANQSRSTDLRRVTAQRFLSRLTWHQLRDEQRKWLDRATVRRLEVAMRRWSATPLDYAALLAQIERQESDAIDLGGIDVASAVQTLRFAESKEANRIAESLNTYYRNANVRVALTDQMIQRLIPEVDAQVQSVRDRILGADVRGSSVVSTDLSLKLVPSTHSWKMILENNGQVSTGANSRQWPVLIRSHSEASFLSSTPLEITPLGAITGSTDVDVRSSTKMRGLNTDFDSIPLVNSLVREIAMNRYDSMAPLAQRIQKNKIRCGVSSEVDSKVTDQLDEASKTLSRRLTGPLNTLKLSPLVVDMETTTERLSARYRVAGDWQLAAFTPRPRAPMSSLLSAQVHQSAFNNTLETILPSSEPKTISDLIEHVKQLFVMDDALSLGEDDQIASVISIQFASTRPITVEIEDGILWITLRIMRLKQDAGIDLRRFIVRAGYSPQVDGLSAKLVRDGHLRISGPDMSMRDRLPVRAIFNKVFSTRRTLSLIPEKWSEHPGLAGLVVTQAELRDGWIAIAIGHPGDIGLTPQIARAKDEDSAPQKERF